MAVRTIACLPAVTGAWRDVGGGVLLSHLGHVPDQDRGPRAARPHAPRHPHPEHEPARPRPHRRGLDPPVKALFVYNSNPAAVAPEQEQVRAGLRRDDLFTVVHELFPTDTVDFADIVLPATTTLEHFDIHKAYGHLYLSLNRPAIAPLGECKPNTEVFRLLAARMGLDDPAFSRATRSWRGRPSTGRTRTCRASPSSGSSARARCGSTCPTRTRRSRTAVPDARPEVRALARRSRRQGLDPLRGLRAAAREPGHDPELAERFPLAFISPPAHHFLNSTFSAQPVFVRREGEPSLTIHPEDAAARGIADGQMVRVFNDRGAFLAKARVSDAARPGVVVGLSIWWAKMCPGGRNANAVTSQELTDMGGGATFYDVLVEVGRL